MWTALDVFIGLALSYALISLFCSIIQEFLAQALDSRGKLLVEALKTVNLGKVISNASAGLVKNPGWLMRLPWLTSWGSSSAPSKLGSRTDTFVDRITGGRRLPHDVSPANLANALVQGSSLLVAGVVAPNFDQVVQGMNLPRNLESRLLTLSHTARQDVSAVKKEIESWFGDFTTQVQHWYTRRAQAASLVIGMLVAVWLNVDTVNMAKTLYHDSAKRDAVVRIAAQLDKTGKVENCPESSVSSDTTRGAINSVRNRAENCFNAIEKVYPFDIGWRTDKKGGIDAQTQMILSPLTLAKRLWEFESFDGLKILGLLLSGLALSLGSRFWFDLLKNLVALRTGGQPDKKAT